jgi:hypothetical protein
VLAALHVGLALQPIDHAAGRTLVEIQVCGELVQGDRGSANESIERMALRDGYVVAADPVAVAKLVDADQIT